MIVFCYFMKAFADANRSAARLLCDNQNSQVTPLPRKPRINPRGSCRSESPMKPYRSIPAGLFAGLSLLAAAHAGVTLPPIFSDHMVLQKSASVPVWGTASPGEKVSIQLDDKSAQATAGADGKWQATLDLSQSGPGPFQMTVKGANNLAIDDVMVGEVWLASGQSNMGATLDLSTGGAQEVAASANPMVRQFYVNPHPSAKVMDVCKGKWSVAGPDTSGHFSAVSYYFQKELQKNLHVPVAIINSSLGGTYVESWMSPQAVTADKDILAVQKADIEESASFPGRLKEYAQKMLAWEQENNRTDQPKGDPNDFAAPSISTADWKTIKLPGSFASAGLPDAGVTWLRKEITVGPEASGRSIRLDLGGIRNFTTVYWNGVKVGETTPATPPGTEGKFTYMIPASISKPGKAVIAVRIYTPEQKAGLEAGASGSNFRAIAGKWVTFLAGDWLAKAEYSLPPLDSAAAQTIPKEPGPPQQEKNIPGYLYNGMIHPLIPYAIRGFIWYQGENNTTYAMQYRKIFPAFINDLRAQWKQENLPFYFCQLAAFGPIATSPSDSIWAELREAQYMATKLPNTGEAILIDIGEEKDIHPRDKKDAGERLGKVALANTYGEKIPYSGPIFQSMQTVDGKIRIQFTHIDGGLVAKPIPQTYRPRSIQTVTQPLIRNSPQSQLEGFAVCGADKQWKWADAKIDGDQVLVWSSQVPQPVAVRYAWSDNPIVNLHNAAGLPAVPFRTDNFPGISSAVRTR
jgi:sialate O-acetylesterase